MKTTTYLDALYLMLTLNCEKKKDIYPLRFSHAGIKDRETNQSEGGDDVFLAVHGQASKQLSLHTALVWQLFQGSLWVLSLCPLLPAANQIFFLCCREQPRETF